MLFNYISYQHLYKWKVIKSEDVSPSKWFPLFKDTVQLQNGHIIDDYYLAKLPNVVLVLPVLKSGEFILVKQYKHAIGKYMIELPGGFVEKGNSLKETAVLELGEEIGCKLDSKNMKLISKTAHHPTKLSSITYVYLAQNLILNQKQNLELTEDIQILKLKPSEILEMIDNGKVWAADTVAAILIVKQKFPVLFRH